MIGARAIGLLKLAAILVSVGLAGCSDGDGFSGSGTRTATVVVEDDVNWLNDGADEVGYVIHEIGFSVQSAGPVTFDILSAGQLAPSLDTQIYLLADDGAPDASDVLYVNDDGAPGDDGSVTGLDSYLQVELEPGDYLLYIGGCCFTADDAIAGYRLVAGSAPLPALTVGDVNGSYQLTVTGDVLLN
jgi:hypothetical protein